MQRIFKAMDSIIEFDRVWKKFKKGRKFNSLRDTIPKLFRFRKTPLYEGLKEGEFWALKDVSFNVKKGEVLGIIGPNGAGKSTILKLLFKILAPNKGKVKVKGRVSGLIEVTAGFHPELTGRENVYLNGTIIGMSRKEIDKKFDEIVEFSGIGEFIDTPVKRYSSGMYARLGFSIVAHMRPDILLVDEVLAVGDSAFQVKCAQKMQELLRSGATIVLVSHNLFLVKNLCKRVILLSEGRKVKEGKPDEVIPYYQNLIQKKYESDLAKKKVFESKKELSQNFPVEITEISLNGKNTFCEDEEIRINIDYFAKERIERPVIGLEIIRSDGILCLSSLSNEDGFFLPFIEGRGKIRVNLGRLNLNNGFYRLKISLWAENFMNMYHEKEIIFNIRRREDVLNNAVMKKKVIWEI
ncbi:MAG: hypothetical protein B6D55_07700 [Candidatus Omnitrophica bacterium 4484_70.2]|nr:MAG: hypothetical protein B6D55_07700 [Candidatus Omnitrophica bacterium 4484_70.2]